MDKTDNVVHDQRLRGRIGHGEAEYRPQPSPRSSADNLAKDAEAVGGAFPPEEPGVLGRTLFDDAASRDRTVSVVFPPERIADVPSQALLRIKSKVDQREYIASVSSGPFCEADGLPANSPQLIVSAVNGHETSPRHHGRLQAAIIGENTAKGMITAGHRPRPNSSVRLVDSAEVSDILNLKGDIRLGLLYGNDDVEVRIDSKSKAVLPRHTAHLGTTGGGKSTGIGRVLHQFHATGTCVIIFDVEGEYTNLDVPNDNSGIVATLAERGLKPEAVLDTHVYRLKGSEAANPRHPSSKEFTLEFNRISPHAFGEIADLSDAQTERLFTSYEIARKLLRDLDIFPKKGNEQHLEMIRDLDDLQRGWPMMKLEDLRYIVSAIIALGQPDNDEEPFIRASQFYGHWQKVKAAIRAVFGGSDDKKSSILSPASWKGLSGKLAQLARLKIFDQGDRLVLDYGELLKPGRINIVDLSDIANNNVRNLAIAEMLRGILERQQEVYDANASRREIDADAPHLMTNVIIEEAHEFLSARRASKMPMLMEQLTTIAKRGRKRYLGLTFVTQSPNDLPDDVLALVNNWLLYKVDDTTIRRLKSFVPQCDDSLWTSVRELGPGQALVSFQNMRRPVIAAIDPSPARLKMTD